MIGNRITVLEKGFIELQELSGYYDDNVNFLFQQITDAARTSYLGDSKGYDADLKLLKYLWKNKHTTPFEMIQFKFRVKLPIVAQNQWVRHRTGSFNIQSGRYTEFDENDVYIPEHFNYQSKKNKQGRAGVHRDDPFLREQYAKRIGQAISTYKQMIDAGVSLEQARLVLPAYAMFSTMVWSVNLKNLLGFLSLRNHPHAQYEIRVYAEAIEGIVGEYLPEVYLLGKEQ